MLVLSALGFAPAQAETLADAIATAYRNNPTIGSARYDVRAADETIVQARAELRPTANLQVTGEYNRLVEGRASEAADPFMPRITDTNRDVAQATVVQPLYTGGRATADRAVAEANVRAGRETLRSTEGDLLLDVITAYIDVRRYEAALAVWQASVTELEKLNKEILARQVAGELTRTDVALADTQLDTAREQVVATEQDIENARTDFAALVGHDPGALAEAPSLPQLPPNVDAAYDLAERRSPELGQAQYTELASREDIAVAKSAGYPTVSLQGTATLSGQAVPFYVRDQDRGFTANVVFTQPLSAGGAIASRIRQARDRDDSDRLKLEAARRALVRNVAAAWNETVTAGRSATLLEAQRRAAFTQLDGMISEYRLGLRSTFDVLYAQQTLRDVEVALLGARRDRYVAEAMLLRQAGLLEVQTIMAGVGAYDPGDHLREVDHRNALPWDGVVATIDRTAAPAARQDVLAPAIAAAGDGLSIDPASTIVGSDAALATSLPVAPAAEAVNRPASRGRKIRNPGKIR